MSLATIVHLKLCLVCDLLADAYDGTGPTLGLSMNQQRLSGEERFTSEQKKQWVLACFWPIVLVCGLAAFGLFVAVGSIACASFVFTSIPAAILCRKSPMDLWRDEDHRTILALWPFALSIGDEFVKLRWPASLQSIVLPVAIMQN